MNGRYSIDTNILIYAVQDIPEKETARDLVGGSPFISVQLLNEFANVVGRKSILSRFDMVYWLKIISDGAAGVRAIDLDVHHGAIKLIERYNFSFYDALIVAAALLDDCETLYTEDMQNGLVVENTLTIRNPFAKAAT